MNKGNIILYQTPDGQSKIEVTLSNDTVWLTADQMAELFQRNKSTISRHIKNVFNSGELQADSVVAKNATTAADNKFSAHGHTAAEIIYERADAGKDFMGLTSWQSRLNKRPTWNMTSSKSEQPMNSCQLKYIS